MKQKIYLNARELADAMGNGSLHSDGTIDRVIVPNLTNKVDPDVSEMEADDGDRGQLCWW